MTLRVVIVLDLVHVEIEYVFPSYSKLQRIKDVQVQLDANRQAYGICPDFLFFFNIEFTLKSRRADL